MWLYSVILLALAVFGLADTSSAQCILTYNATQPPQIGPVTTIYQAIMTTFLYVSVLPSTLRNMLTDDRLWIVASVMSQTLRMLRSR